MKVRVFGWKVPKTVTFKLEEWVKLKLAGKIIIVCEKNTCKKSRLGNGNVLCRRSRTMPQR